MGRYDYYCLSDLVWHPLKMTFKVGLTGGIACGKSTVCHLFKDLGVTVIDADEIARQLVKPGRTCYQQVVDYFGSDICLGNKEIDRKQLRQRIFAHSEDRKKLESILHPAIRQRMLIEAENCLTQYCILAVPLLLETHMEDLVDRILVVDLPVELQLHRLCKRDQISPSEAEKIINVQFSRQQRLAAADDIIDNSCEPSELPKLVSTYHHQYIALSSKKH